MSPAVTGRFSYILRYKDFHGGKFKCLPRLSFLGGSFLASYEMAIAFEILTFFFLSGKRKGEGNVIGKNTNQKKVLILSHSIFCDKN